MLTDEIPQLLFHFTCRHFANRIGNVGQLRPNPGTGLVWLTDLDAAPRSALGLTSHLLECDRTECRYVIDEPHDIEPWMITRRRIPELARILESTTGAMPRHWFVSRVSQSAHLG